MGTKQFLWMGTIPWFKITAVVALRLTLKIYTLRFAVGRAMNFFHPKKLENYFQKIQNIGKC